MGKGQAGRREGRVRSLEQVGTPSRAGPEIGGAGIGLSASAAYGRIRAGPGAVQAERPWPWGNKQDAPTPVVFWQLNQRALDRGPGRGRRRDSRASIPDTSSCRQHHFLQVARVLVGG